MRAGLTDVSILTRVIFLLFKLFAQRRLPDFTASIRLSDKFKMADAADDMMLQLLDTVNAKMLIG